MEAGSIVVNANKDVGYTVASPFQDKESKEWFVRVIWVDQLLEAEYDNYSYPNTLTITDERQDDLY